MFDSIQKRVPWVIAAVLMLTVAGQAAMAESEDGVAPSAVANVNADRVDGRHAIKYTSNTAARKGRLMAIGATGYLPNNIILKAVDADKIDGIDSTALATIAALQSSAGTVNEAGNLVHWNQLFGVPPTLADGADHVGYASATQATVYPMAAAPATLAVAADTPLGTDVELVIIPAAGGPSLEIVKEFMTQGYAAFPAPWGDVAAGYVRHWYHVASVGAATTFKVRTRVYDTGIAPAAMKKVAKMIDVQVGTIPRAFRR